MVCMQLLHFGVGLQGPVIILLMETSILS